MCKRLQLALVLLLTAIFSVKGADPPASQPAGDPFGIVESKLLYYPRKYDADDIAAFLKNGGVQLDYKTSQGSQTAWLIKPAKGAKAERLWMVSGGNATLALDMASFFHDAGLASDAIVLVDYPGYGKCEGNPSPETVAENVKAATIAAGEKVGIDPVKKPELVCAFGHSLGCAAALMVVEAFDLKAVVLCSPFTSTHEMAELKFGIAKTAVIKHQYDNRLGLKALQKTKGHAWIIHGAEDEIIPVKMSQTMAAEFPDVVKLQVIKDGHHNDILEVARKEILQAMADARK